MDWNTWASLWWMDPTGSKFGGSKFSQESLVISADFRDKTMKCYKLTLKTDENRWLACSRWYWYRLDLQHFYLDSRVDKQVSDRIPGWIMTWSRNSPWQKTRTIDEYTSQQACGNVCLSRFPESPNDSCTYQNIGCHSPSCINLQPFLGTLQKSSKQDMILIHQKGRFH